MSDIDDDKNIQKLLQIRLLYYFFFTIPHKVVFYDLPHFLGTANLSKNSLLIRTISIAWTIPSQRLSVFNLVFVGVVLGRCSEEKRCSEPFHKSKDVVAKGFTS